MTTTMTPMIHDFTHLTLTIDETEVKGLPNDFPFTSRQDLVVADFNSSTNTFDEPDSITDLYSYLLCVHLAIEEFNNPVQKRIRVMTVKDDLGPDFSVQCELIITASDDS